MRVSVLIITKDRGKHLADCLDSLKRQSTLPYEVVVVDNCSTDNTKEIVNLNKDTLNINYSFEQKLGRSFARNKGLKKVKGEVVAFIDDDCVADKNWIENVSEVFEKNKILAGLVGFSQNYYCDNIYSQVEQFFYLRWLHENLGTSSNPAKITNGSLIDTKNSAFRQSEIKNLSFKSGIYDQDEDVIFGNKLIALGKKIVFVPMIKVHHKNSNALVLTLKKNFMKGCSWEKIKNHFSKTEYKKKISLQETVSLFDSYFLTSSVTEKIFIFIVSILYVLSYKIGVIYSRLFILVLPHNKFIH